MKHTKIKKTGALVLTVFLLGSLVALPLSGAVNIKIDESSTLKQVVNQVERYRFGATGNSPTDADGKPVLLDTYYVEDPE
jgi:hypothetical protein